MAGRPLIGITVAEDDGNPAFHRLRKDYVRSVEKAGGVPVLLAPVDEALVPALLERVDGLVFSGGADVDPARYGHEPHPKLGPLAPQRDGFELALLRAAVERDVPCLCICRGHQVLNVALGGTLIQDLPSKLSGGLDHDPRKQRDELAHDVALVPGTRLHAILGGQPQVAVNSFHHQAIDTPAPGLVVCARAADGVIEGAELPGRRLVLGVQWHPESFWRRDPGFDPLFRALCEAAA